MYRKIRKALSFIFISFLLIIQTAVPNVVIAADNEFDMFYQDVVTKVKAGESVVYRLNLRVKGVVNDDTKMRKVIITLPGAIEGLTEFDKGTFTTIDDKLKSMAIEGVEPTYEKVNDGYQLVYDFGNKLKLGSTYSVEIPIKTLNGIIPNGHRLYPRAEYWENGNRVFYKEPSNPTVIESSTQAEISKTYVGTDGHDFGGSYTPRNGDTIVWKIKATIPYNEIGQAYLKEGSKIVITDRIQGTYHEFVRADDGVNNNGLVTWTFDAPTLAEQKARAARDSSQNLWEREFLVRTKVKNVPVSAIIHNKAKISITDIGDNSSSSESNDVNLLVVSGKDGITPNSQQGFMQGLVAGPADEKGTVIADINEFEDRHIEVKSAAYLGYGMFFRISPAASIIQYSNGKREYKADKGELPYEATYDKDGNRKLTPTNYPTEEIANVNYWNGYRRIIMKRIVDPNLVLEDIEIGVPVRWARLNADGTPDDYQEFGKLPEVNIKLTVTDDKSNLSTVYVPVVYRDLKDDPLKWGYKNGDSNSQGVPLKVMKLTRKDLKELKDFARVIDYEVEFRPADDDNRDDDFTKGQKVIPGDFFVNVYDHYTIKPGATGVFKNRAEYTTKVLRWHGWRKEYTEFVRAEDPSRPGGAMGARSVIVNADIKYPTSVTVNAELEKRDGNVIDTGDNILKFRMVGNYPTPANADPNVTATLLPFGVSVDTTKERRWKYIDAEGNVIEESPNQIEVIDNFKGTGRQLVRVRWQNKVLSPRRSLEVSVPVKISKDVTKDLVIPVYGGVNNPDINVVTPNVKIKDDKDINENNRTDDNLVTTTVRYTMVNKNNLKIEKSVRGDIDREYAAALEKRRANPNDADLKATIDRMERVRSAYLGLKGTSDTEMYSKYGITSFGGNIEYKLKMTNTTGEKITKMGFVDLLPGVGDYGIVNYGNARGSTFTPTLTGPIQVPDSWKGKVDITYTKVSEPQRNMFDGKVDVPGFVIPNIQGLQDANWMSEGAVGGDWASVRGFKIDLKPGVEWIEGQNIEVKFTMKAPEDKNMMTKVAKNAGEANNIARQKTAWNTFAVTTNGLLPVEPERVGVSYLEPLHVKVRKLDSLGNEVRTGRLSLKFWIDKIEGNPGGLWYTRDGGDIDLSRVNPFTFEKIDRFSTAQATNTYWITEEAAPAGYVKTNNRYKVVLNAATRTVTYESIQNGPTGLIEKKNQLLYDELDPNLQGDKEKTVDIVNSKIVLPKTGGYGATLYILIGGSLIILSRKIKNNTKGDKYNEEI